MEKQNTLCGLGPWRPKFMQRFASRKMYIFVYSLLGVIQGMGFTYLSSVLSTIEKQFGIKSQEAAWIFSGNEISQIFFILVLPFLPRIKKRTLWTSIAMMLSALGFFLCATPFFAKDKELYRNGWEVQQTTASGLCLPDEGDTKTCNPNKVRDWGGMFTIFVGFFISGIGTSFYYSFGVPYLDDNVSKDNSPLALGIMSAARTMGPAMGFLLGNACLAVYVDPAAGVELKEGDKGWLGAWWLGFVIVAVLTALISPFLGLFPQTLPSDVEMDAHKLEKKLEATQVKSVKDYWRETKECLIRLGKNKIYVFSSLSSVFFLFGIIGFATFIPKLFEYNYRQKASSSGSFSGLAKAVGSAIGMLLSGYLIGRFKFRARVLAGWNLFVTAAAIVILVSVFQIDCPTELKVYQGDCASDCMCTGSKFEPTCSEDGVTLFFSPCHAGCRNSHIEPNVRNKRKGIQVFSNCTCVEQAAHQLGSKRVAKWWQPPPPKELPSPLVTSSLQDAPDGTSPPPPVVASVFQLVDVEEEEEGSPLTRAVEGFCPSDCDKVFYIVVGSMLAYSLLGSTGRVGSTLISLRSVDPHDKSASLLILVSAFSLFAFLPSPLVVGKILDNTCTVWGENCGEKTNCLLYDTHAMRTNISAFVASFMFIGLMFDSLVWYYVRDLKIFDEEKEPEEKEEKAT